MIRKQRTGPSGWPLPPRLAPSWTARRAVWWLRLMQAGRVHRVHGELTTLARRRIGSRHQGLLRYGDALRQEWRTRIEAGPAGPALARADHPNYLGSRAVVRSLVDGYIALLIARAGGTAPHSACEAEMHRLAAIFAGADPEYAPIGGWNTRGLLGDAAIRRVPLDAGLSQDTPLDGVLRETFAAVGLAALRILRAADRSKIGADAALARLAALAERTAALLVGTADSRPATVTLLAVVADLPDLAGPGNSGPGNSGPGGSGPGA